MSDLNIFKHLYSFFHPFYSFFMLSLVSSVHLAWFFMSSASLVFLTDYISVIRLKSVFFSITFFPIVTLFCLISFFHVLAVSYLLYFLIMFSFLFKCDYPLLKVIFLILFLLSLVTMYACAVIAWFRWYNVFSLDVWSILWLEYTHLFFSCDPVSVFLSCYRSYDGWLFVKCSVAALWFMGLISPTLFYLVALFVCSVPSQLACGFSLLVLWPEAGFGVHQILARRWMS